MNRTIKHWTTTAVFLAPLLLSACAEDEVEELEEEYGLEVDVEINPDADFSAYETFDVVVPSDVLDEAAPFEFAQIEDDLIEAIAAELSDAGLTRDTDSPDVIVNPVINVREVIDYVQLYDAYYGYYWGYDYGWTTAYEYTQGTLILDVVAQNDIEAEDDDVLVYSGRAWGLMAEDLPVVRLELRNAVNAIFAQWPEPEPQD